MSSTLSNILSQLTTWGVIQEKRLSTCNLQHCRGTSCKEILPKLLGLKGWCMRKIKKSLLNSSFGNAIKGISASNNTILCYVMKGS